MKNNTLLAVLYALAGSVFLIFGFTGSSILLIPLGIYLIAVGAGKLRREK